MNCEAAASTDWPFCLARSFTKASTPSDIVGTRQHRIDRHGGAARHLGQPARDRKLGGLGHSIVDHLARYIQRGFRGDEDDASPIALQHARHVGARQPHARHHIDFKETAPVLIGDIEEALGFENPGIVDEDVDIRLRPDQHLATGIGRDIGGNAPNPGSRHRPGDRGHRLIDLGLGPAVDHHVSPSRSEAPGDGVTDAGRRARHQRGLSLEVDIHAAASNVTRDLIRTDLTLAIWVRLARPQSPFTRG